MPRFYVVKKNKDNEKDMWTVAMAQIRKDMNAIEAEWEIPIEVAAISHQWFNPEYLSILVAYRRRGS